MALQEICGLIKIKKLRLEAMFESFQRVEGF